MIISVINVKGGVGKTVSTIFLATALLRRGAPVQVWDLDRQASAWEWATIARENGNELGFEVNVVVPCQLASLTQSIDEEKYIVIDTPPGDIEAIDAAIHVGDFIVVPTKTRTDDMTRTWRMITVLSHKPYAVLLTQVRKGTSSAKIAIESLKRHHASFFDTIIYEREPIGNTYGNSPGKTLYGYEQVIEEILKS